MENKSTQKKKIILVMIVVLSVLVLLTTVSIRLIKTKNGTIELTINETDFETLKQDVVISGTFNSSIDIKDITYSIESYSDNGIPSSSGKATISGKKWTCDLRLKPDYNKVTIIAENIRGYKTTKQIIITYNSTTMYTPEESNITYSETIGMNYADNIILIYFKSDISNDEIDNIVEEINGTIVGQNNTLDLYQIMIEKKSLEEIQDICNKIMDNYDKVVYATYDTVYSDVTSLYSPNDPWNNDVNKSDWTDNIVNGSNWWAETIEVQYAWEYKERFNTTLVGIFDSSFDVGHEDLKNRYSFPNSRLENLNNNETIKIDVSKKTSYHGTHVAGIIGAEADNKKGLTGVALNSKMLFAPWYSSAEKIALENRWDASLYASLTYLVESGAKVINFSLGKAQLLDASKRNKDYIKREGNLASISISKLIEKGYDFNIVQSAGNDNGIDSLENGWFASITDNCVTCSDKISIDEVMNRVIIVAAVAETSDDNYTLTDFSNCGEHISIAAPGENIYSCVPGDTFWGFEIYGGYSEEKGTSMAAPIVTGVASLVWSINENFTAEEVKEIVCNYTNKTAKGYGDDTLKYSMVNAKLAVEEAIRRTDNGYGTVSGTIKDKETGQPLENVTVTIKKDETTRTVKTNENGMFKFKLPVGNWKITLSSDTHYNNEYMAVKIEKDVDRVLQNVIYMSKISKITGTVKDNDTSKAIKGVTVKAIDNKSDSLDPIATTTTDENGKFTLELPYGNYSLSFKHNDYVEYGMSLSDINTENTVLLEDVLLTAKIAELTNDYANELWKTANDIYCSWVIHRDHNGYTDSSDSIQLQTDVFGYVTDWTYYRVKHNELNSVSQLNSYLSSYFDSNICNNITCDFTDYNGKLYSEMIDGLGDDFREYRGVTVKEQSDDTAIISINFYDTVYGESYSVDQTLRYENGKWIFADYFNYCYGNKISDNKITLETEKAEENKIASTDNIFYQFISDNLNISSSFPTDDKKERGVFSVLVDDFDGDGNQEMITFSVTHNDLDKEFIVLDLYVLKNGEIVISDSSIEMHASGAGNYQNTICATFENNIIKIYCDSFSYGGSSHDSSYLSYKVENDKLVLRDRYILNEFYRYETYTYKEAKSGEFYSTLKDFYLAVANSGYDIEKHYHIGYSDAEFDINQDNYMTAECFKGNHIFTLFNQSGAYGFIYDNTKLSDKL